MPKYYIPKEEFKIIPKEEIQPYLDAARDEDYKTALAVVWLTGMRIQEVVLLKARQISIDPTDQSMEIRFQALKRGRIGVPNFSWNDTFVSDVVLPYVQGAYAQGRERLFKRKSKSSYQKTLQAINKQLHGEAKERYITFHQFRHSRATYLVRLGATTDELIAWFGRRTTDFSDYTIATKTSRFRGHIK